MREREKDMEIMKITKKSKGFDWKDEINIKNGDSFKNLPNGTKFTVAKAAVFESVNSDGESVETAAYIDAESGAVYTTISTDAVLFAPTIIAALDKGEKIVLEVLVGETKAGNSYVGIRVH